MMQNLLENRGLVSYDPLSEAEVTEIHQQVTSYLNGSLPDLQVSLYTFIRINNIYSVS